MEDISRKDLIALLSAIERLHSDNNPLTLAERTLQAVIGLIPNEITSFDAFGGDSHYNGYLWYSPAGTVSEKSVERLGELVHEHPMFQDVMVEQRMTTAKISQYMPLAKFQETALYHEFYKHIGGDTQMMTAFNVSPQLFVTCSLHQQKKDFTERDLAVLGVLAPHLKAIFRNAQIFNRLSEQKNSTNEMFDAVGYGILTLDAEITVCEQNLTAVRMLHEYFSASEALPEALIDYVKFCAEVFTRNEVFLPTAPLVVKKIDGVLKIRVSPQFQTRTIIVFLEETKPPSIAALTERGLTRREIEILLWISKGKTDADIARIGCISVRTVHKHRENIFKKLGVETRTAAAATVNELLFTRSGF